MRQVWSVLSCILFSFSLNAARLTFSLSNADKNKTETFTVKFDLSGDESIYHDSVQVSVNSRAYELMQWHVNGQPLEVFDAAFNKTKKVFKQAFIVTGTVQQKADDADASLVVSYWSTQNAVPLYEFFTLQHTMPVSVKAQKSENIVPVVSESAAVPVISCLAMHEKHATISGYVQTLITSSNSWTLRLLLVLLLGMLMSLTPCIYPMIPITIGILHGTRSRSRGYRLLRALCYMLGVAFMFALLGAIAAFTGTMCGALLRHPLMIMLIVLFLLYLAFAMFDWYELRLPRFLVVRKHGMQPSDSLVSAFMFGFASGTIASPCLSPGLAFLLCIVTALGSKLLGFALLFAFGVGMSIPLLLIGTFAPVISYVPRAGSWMLGIKKLMGVLLVALSFYFLSMVIPVVVVWWLVATIVTVLAGYLMITAYQRYRPGTRERLVRVMVGMMLLALATGLYWYAAQSPRIGQIELINWQTAYGPALKQAREQNKLLFVDIGAPYCSVCKAIDQCVFTDATIAAIINQMIPLKLDTSSSPDYELFNKKYHVLGVPTILIINPVSGVIIKQFGGELYSMPKAELVRELSDLVSQG